MKKIKIIELAILVGMLTAIASSMINFSTECKDIRSKLLRMHVVANSDSNDDQELKLKVRDAILEAGREYFDGSIAVEDAEKILIPKIEELTAVAENVISENGYDYDVKINIGKANFPTRVYEENNITLPAGEYEAVNVIIGEGKGHNWWCVMFPPMCLPAAQNDIKLDDVLDENEIKIVKSDAKYDARFKIIEIIEKINEKI